MKFRMKQSELVLQGPYDSEKSDERYKNHNKHQICINVFNILIIFVKNFTIIFKFESKILFNKS